MLKYAWQVALTLIWIVPLSVMTGWRFYDPEMFIMCLLVGTYTAFAKAAERA